MKKFNLLSREYRPYIVIFCLALIIFSAVIFIGATAFSNLYKPDPKGAVEPYKPSVSLPGSEDGNVEESGGDSAQEEQAASEEPKVEKKTELQELVESSSRINVLILGKEDTRTDTIMVASFDPETQCADLISVPRDTYVDVPGFKDETQFHKINSIYGKKGTKGLMQEIANILGVPLHYYVKLDYQGVSSIVDVLDGVEIDVKQDMKYDDIWADPPLHIDIPKGKQVLDGETALKYLRWRQNNEKSGSGSDISRTSRQRDFIKVVLKKSLGTQFVAVISTAMKFVETDMGPADMVYYAENAAGMNTSKLKTYITPGKAIAHSPYYVSNFNEAEKMMIDIYKRQ